MGADAPVTIPDGFDHDPARLLDQATRLLDAHADYFVAGLGAPSAVDKGPADFATAVDLEIERRLSAELAQATGIGVHGEEFGGPPMDSGTVWILDPVDGTYNYSAGLPTAGILLGLVHDGVPVLGLTWLPVARRTFAAALGGPLLIDGTPAPPLAPTRLAESMVAYPAFKAGSRGRFPGDYRIAGLEQLSRRASKLRIHGSVGADLAYAAAGAVGVAVSFGAHPWDHAAGVALVRAAGGTVTDLAGAPWRVGADSVLAGGPGAHAEALEIFTGLGPPKDFPARRDR